MISKPIGSAYHKPSDSYIAIYRQRDGALATRRGGCLVPLSTGAYIYDEDGHYGQVPQIWPDTERNDDSRLPAIVPPGYVHLGQWQKGNQ